MSFLSFIEFIEIMFNILVNIIKLDRSSIKIDLKY